jgi:hypothetical protein
MNCADKFLKHSERIGARFAEQNAGELEFRFPFGNHSADHQSLEMMNAAQSKP